MVCTEYRACEHVIYNNPNCLDCHTECTMNECRDIEFSCEPPGYGCPPPGTLCGECLECEIVWLAYPYFCERRMTSTCVSLAATISKPTFPVRSEASNWIQSHFWASRSPMLIPRTELSSTTT